MKLFGIYGLIPWIGVPTALASGMDMQMALHIVGLVWLVISPFCFFFVWAVFRKSAA